MGAGFSGISVLGAVDSLNKMFSAANIVALKQNYMNLTVLYPSFLQYTPRAPGTNRRTWRTSTLRYAALLLTAEVDLNFSDYPGRDFIRWLKWLTWVQTLGPPDAVVTIIPPLPPAPSTTTPPAKAISDTLILALNDPRPNPVHFVWTEVASGLMTVTVDQTPGITHALGTYQIAVASIRSDDIAVPVSDNDEDKQIP